MLDPLCTTLLVAVFVGYTVYELWLDFQLDPYRRGVPKPHHEDMFPTERARRLFRRERLLDRWQIVVWIGTAVLLNVLCVK